MKVIVKRLSLSIAFMNFINGPMSFLNCQGRKGPSLSPPLIGGSRTTKRSKKS
ncbi:MAG: hypothetical protein [Chaetfec virus UA24_244]|nr:MAG: hypothetical protein [Chaetfec virus UA24_244]